MKTSAILSLPLVAALAAPALAGPLSGLPWASGAKDNLTCLGTLRSRTIDLQHIYINQTSNLAGTGPGDFPTMVNNAQNWVSSYIRNGPPVTLLSIDLLPYANKGQLSTCASGSFDGYWKQIGTALKSAASTTSTAKPSGTTLYVEPGWEANIGSHSHPWGVDDISQVASYKSCWQHVTAALRSVFSGTLLKVVWSNATPYNKNFSVAQMDPGTEDTYGLLYYDNTYNKSGPLLPITSTTWNNALNSYSGTGGSPTGIGAWMSYAKSHGKKMGLSEWGIWNRSVVTPAQADDPAYINYMFGFFKANSANMAYDAYQNVNLTYTDGHELCPSTNWPNARNAYGSDFKAG